MSLATVRRVEVVKKQYFYKLKANIDAFSSLVGIQLLAMAFSLGGVGSFSSGTGSVSIMMRYFSADMVIAFSMIWGLATAITLTTKPHRYHDFSFVTNRVTSSLSNVLYLLTASAIAGLTAMLSRSLIVFAAYFFWGYQVFDLYTQPFRFSDFLLGVVVATLYIFFMSAIGYFIGSLVQVNKIFVLFAPLLIIGSIFYAGMTGRIPAIVAIFEFYFLETSFVLFLLKIVVSTAVFFGVSIGILNRLEVRK